MTQHVRMHVTREALLDRPLRESTLDRARRQASAMYADEERGFGCGASRGSYREPRFDGRACSGADRNDALLRAFAEHAHFAGRQIDAIDIEPREFSQSQP